MKFNNNPSGEYTNVTNVNQNQVNHNNNPINPVISHSHDHLNQHPPHGHNENTKELSKS